MASVDKRFGLLLLLVLGALACLLGSGCAQVPVNEQRRVSRPAVVDHPYVVFTKMIGRRLGKQVVIRFADDVGFRCKPRPFEKRRVGANQFEPVVLGEERDSGQMLKQLVNRTIFAHLFEKRFLFSGRRHVSRLFVHKEVCLQKQMPPLCFGVRRCGRAGWLPGARQDRQPWRRVWREVAPLLLND